MRHSDLIIDGENLREDYGVTLCQGSTAGFLSLAQFKDVDSDDWAEEDYIDVDASAPVFRRKEFDLTIQGGASAVDNFCMWSNYYYIPLTITNTPFELEKCLIKGVTGLTILRGVSRATIRYTSDDDPYTLLDQHDDPTAFDRAGWQENYSFIPFGGSAIDFGDIGVRVLGGTAASFMAKPSAKQPLTRDVSTTAGMIYDEHNGSTVSGSKRSTLQCLLNYGKSYDDFWNRYLYFLRMCTMRGGVRIITPQSSGWWLYNGMRVTEYIPLKTVPWLKFSVDFIRIARS